MATPPNFEQVCNDIRQFRQMIDRSLARLAEGPVRQQTQALAQVIDSKLAELQKLYPKTMAELDAKIAHATQEAQQVLSNMAALQETLAQTKEVPPVEAPSAAPSAPPPVDPMLGRSLRSELLTRFRPRQKQEEDSQQLREVWQDWDEWKAKL